MRTPPILLSFGLLLWGCDGDPTGTPGYGSLAVSTSTSGLDVDGDGYHVALDGLVRTTTSESGTVTLARIDPGSHTVTLASLAPNCTVQGTASREVTIVEDEVASLEFSVVCTATTGVVEVLIETSGSLAPDAYALTWDAGPVHRINSGEPLYLSQVSAGNHSLVLVLPGTCSARRNPRIVAVSVGSLVRDTVQAAFTVECGARQTALWVAVPTSGLIPPSEDGLDNRFAVLLWGPDRWDFPTELGRLKENGTLMAPVAPGRYRLELEVPMGCVVSGTNPSPEFDIVEGSTRDFDIPVVCYPPWDY